MAGRRRSSTSRVKTGTVGVEGLGELSRALKELGPEFPKEMRKVNKTTAEKVAQHARSNALALGGVAAKAAPSVKASAGVKSAGVALGGQRYPFAAGAEFGSVRFKQFPIWRGNGSDAGYFLYPAIREDADQIHADYMQALDDLVRRVGLD